MLFYLCIMCIFVLIFYNKVKIMTRICIFTHFGLNITHPFLYFVTLKGCLYKRAVMRIQLTT